MTIRVGVIAEDQSDVDVLNAVIRKACPKAKYCIRQFLGHGCGKVRRKCGVWAQQLNSRGCQLLILLHDRDDHPLDELRQELRVSLGKCPIQRHSIIIPVREIEAWLLSDVQAIKVAMNIKKAIPAIANPEADSDPKRKLGDLIYRRSDKKKDYVNTLHNRLIAEELNLVRLRKCSSFRPLEEFLTRHLG